MKRTPFLILTIILLLYLLVFPQEAIAASKNGIHLWFHTIMPTMLPFLILSGLLIHSGAIHSLTNLIPDIICRLFGVSSYGIYVLTMGILCGYPMGAKLTADLYRNNIISENEASYLLTISNNPGPMFLSGYLIHQLLHIEKYTGLIFLLLYTSSFLCSLIFRSVYHRWTADISNVSLNKKEVSSIPFSELLDTSIMNGFESITKLGGYILLFSLISAMLETLLPVNMFCQIIKAITEITTGSEAIAALSWPLSLKTAVILGSASFGGISCIFQASSMIQNTPLSVRMYCLSKILNGLLTFLLVQLLFVF